MTKLSHIPMQIQKWIASLAHLFFLILGLIGTASCITMEISGWG